MTQEIHIYEVDCYLRKEYLKDVNTSPMPLTMRFEDSSQAYDYFMMRKRDNRVWQLFYRTITRVAYTNESGEWLAFTEETTRTTHWINPSVLCLG